MTQPKAKPPVPLGLLAGVVVLVLVVGAVLAFALTRDEETKVEEAALDGLVTETNLSQNHTNVATADPIAYPDRATRPPLGGNHNAVWQDCRVYDQPVATEHAVHSLEHGAVWITYAPGLASEQVTALDALAEGQSHVLVSPYTGQQAKVALTAWGRQLSVESPGDPRVRAFLDTYVEGPQTPEPGATCESPLTMPGTVPYATSDGRTFTPSTATEPVTANGEID